MTKDIVMNYNYYYMGAVLSGLEIIAMGGAIWNEA